MYHALNPKLTVIVPDVSAVVFLYIMLNKCLALVELNVVLFMS